MHVVYDGRSSFSCSGIYEEVHGGRYPGTCMYRYTRHVVECVSVGG